MYLVFVWVHWFPFSWSVDIREKKFSPFLLVLVVLHECEDGFALLNMTCYTICFLIMSTKFMSMFKNEKNSCPVSQWSSTCQFICFIYIYICVCVCVREGGRDCCIMTLLYVRERDCVCVRNMNVCL